MEDVCRPVEQGVPGAFLLGERFWLLTNEEERDIAVIFRHEEIRQLATMLRCREDDVDIRLLDAVYWLKGAVRWGRLRCRSARGRGKREKYSDYCFIDVKGAPHAAALQAKGVTMPANEGERVVEGARYLSPYLGELMQAVSVLGKPASCAS